MLLILPISATIIPLLFKKWFLMSSLVCPLVSGVQIMTKTVPNVKEVQIVDRLFLYIVKGQLISECPFGVMVWTNEIFFPGFLP
jgi:hypothetical protein